LPSRVFIGAKTDLLLLSNPHSPKVEFCGYSIPHPSEPKMNLRIQTYGEITAKDALIQGLSDLRDLCDVVTDKFVAEKERWDSEKGRS